MCGIAGIIVKEHINNPKTILQDMNNVQSHRGPDDEGIYESTTAGGAYYVGLAHRRLSIIDLSTGHQPMYNEDKKIVIVFNGEIYNFKDLQDELVQKGHKFITNSDTETIIHAYEEYGESCVDLLRGMFAFAIWDSSNEKLFIARDRFGKKPLYFQHTKNSFAFSSEIKSLLKNPEIIISLNNNSLKKYLQYRYVPGPETLYTGIIKLMPGTYAVWEKGNLKENRYYSPYDGFQRNDLLKQPANPVNAFLEVLDESVKIRMISDVPFGAFLSGGLDSSAIVALMTRYSPFPVKTFSVGFAEEKYNEANYARLIAEKFKTDHHELIINADHLMEHLPELIRFRDAPVSESSDIPIFLLSKFAGQTVKMVLTGEGSDEILGGYPKHRYEKYVKLYQYMPELLRRKLIEPAVNSLPYSMYRAKTAITNLGLSDIKERFPRWFGALTKSEVKELVSFDVDFTPDEEFQFSFENFNLQNHSPDLKSRI